MGRATNWAVAAVGVGGVVGVGFWLLAPRTEPTREDSEQASAGPVPAPRLDERSDLRRIHYLLSGLDERLRRLEMAVADTQVPEPTPPGAEAKPTNDPARSTAASLEGESPLTAAEATAGAPEPGSGGHDGDPIEAVRRLREHWDSVLHEQDVDPGWTYAAEKELGEIVRRPDLGGAQLSDVDCRSTFCALRLVFATTQQRESFFNGFAPAARNFGGFFMVAEGWDDTQVEVYVPRPGFQLPAQEDSSASNP